MPRFMRIAALSFVLTLAVFILGGGICFATTTDHPLVSVLGKSVDNPDVKKLFASYNEEPKISNYAEMDGTVYYTFQNSGISFLFKRNVLDTIFLYSEGLDKNKQYRGPIPMGIAFSDIRPVATRRLGPATQSGGGQKAPPALKVLGETIPLWDKWVYPKFALHLEYFDDLKVRMITLMRNTPDR